MQRFILIISIIVSVFGISATPRAQAAEQRCFSETGFCIEGRLRQFWEQNGGLPVFGFPIGNPEQITVDGKSVTAQRFERNRLELHPNNAAPYDVLLGRLGADRLTQQGRDWFTFPKSGDSGGCRVFAETGHAVCGEILSAWRKNGLQLDNKAAVSEAESLALFGLPISGVVTETLSDGKQYQVQWFERARFELHPENFAPYHILLGLLGNEVVQPAQSLVPTNPSPGSSYVPITSRMFDWSILERLGYKNDRIEAIWVIHKPFAPGLHRSIGVIQSDLRDGLVQYFTLNGTMTYQNTDYIGILHSISEFTDNSSADRLYNEINVTDTFVSKNQGEKTTSKIECPTRFSVGYTSDNILGGTLVMRCENKVLLITVIGVRDDRQLDTLFNTITTHFAISFRTKYATQVILPR